MGKIVEHDDGEPVKLKKKSKKDKNMTNDTLPSGDDHGGVETDSNSLKKKKKHKHKEKTNDDEDQHDKGVLVDDDLQKKNKKKKRKSEPKEDGDEDQHDNDISVNDDLQKNSKSKKRKSEPKEDGDEDQHDNGISVNDDLQKNSKSKKRKSEPKEDVDEDQHDEGISVNDDLQKKSKKKKRKHSSEEAQIEEDKQERNTGSVVENDCDPKPEKKKKKKKTEGQSLETEMSKTVKVKSKVKNKTTAPVENDTEKSKSKLKSKSKKVSFSGHVEVFPISGTQPENETASNTQSGNETTQGDSLLRGKRFTPEEDEIVKQAVLDYIDTKGLGDDGLNMVLNCSSHKGMKKCWQEIGLCIPYRPCSAVRYRAHILFERSENRSWSQEETETLKEFQKKYGNDWKKTAEVLGKHRVHVKDKWRRIKLDTLKAGRWSQDEYQNLYDLVNLDLLLKVNGEEKRKSKHGMLRDNIPWTAISEKLTTRSDAVCCMKWYNQLTSSLVAEKKWADADDYRMIGALYEIDAACIEDVDWDNLLEHRDGEICLKRWKEMVRYIGDYASKSFGEQVDILAKRYCPDAAETREAFDNMPFE